jgi:proline iminopeptidase
MKVSGSAFFSIVVACFATAVTTLAADPPQASKQFTRQELTQIVANARKIVATNGVEELLEIPVGGTKQWISVRGRDRANPVLLVIHGGPASPEMPASWYFESGWKTGAARLFSL